MGIRGVTEFKQAKDYLNALPQDQQIAFVKSLAMALEWDEEGCLYFLDQMGGDPQVEYVELMWKEFGGT